MFLFIQKRIIKINRTYLFIDAKALNSIYESFKSVKFNYNFNYYLIKLIKIFNLMRLIINNNLY